MKRFLAASMALVLLALVGCSGSQGTKPAPESSAPSTPAAQPEPKKEVPGVTDTEIVIGTWMPLTGPAAPWAVIGKTYEAYFKMVNEKGGINGRKVRVIIEDDGYNPAKTVPLVKKMVEQDKVFAFMGGLGTASGTAVMQYIIDNKVPHLAPSTGAGAWSVPTKPGYYAWQINYGTEAKILVKYGLETLKKKKFAIFYQNDDYGKEGLTVAKESLAKGGGEVVAEVAYNVTDTDYSGYALKLKQSGAEAVLAWPSVKQYASLLKEAEKIGFKPAWLASATGNDQSLTQLAGSAAEGAYFVAYLPDPNDPANANIPAIKEWRENLQKYSDLPFSNFTLYGWGQARMMHEILNRAGKDLTRESFEKAAQSLKGWQDLATVTYTADDRRGITIGWIAQVKNGVSVKVSDPIKAD
jgi:ABC-type branched-subunit amino acid transport system substrate-binding protein